MSTRLKIALQKKGRLADGSFDLLKKIGLTFTANGRYLILKCTDFPADLLLLRDDDIPAFVASGSADLGIVGQNIVAESNAKVREVQQLGFGRCRLAVAVPARSRIKRLTDLRGKTIGTEYLNTTRRFFAKQKIAVKLAEISGSAEIAPEMGLADAIVDLVETGTTLEAHDLAPLDPPVLVSEAVLIASPKLAPAKAKLLTELTNRISAVQAAAGKKYVMLNCSGRDLPKIEKILPSLEAPTVLPLAKTGEVAVHSVVTESQFWTVLPVLKQAGARDILLLNIEKLVA